MNELINTTSTWCESQSTSFNGISQRFELYHQNVWNIFFHFVTTPLGLMGLFGVIRYTTKSSSFLLSLNCLYLLTLLPLVPNGVFLGTAILCFFIVYMTCKLDFNILACLSLIIAGK